MKRLLLLGLLASAFAQAQDSTSFALISESDSAITLYKSFPMLEVFEDRTPLRSMTTRCGFSLEPCGSEYSIPSSNRIESGLSGGDPKLPHQLNTRFGEGFPTITADGKRLYFSQSEDSSIFPSTHFVLAERTSNAADFLISQKIKFPEEVEMVLSAFISGDELSAYVVSYDMRDVWICTRETAEGDFTKVRPLSLSGVEYNSRIYALSASHDEQTLLAFTFDCEGKTYGLHFERVARDSFILMDTLPVPDASLMLSSAQFFPETDMLLLSTDDTGGSSTNLIPSRAFTYDLSKHPATFEEIDITHSFPIGKSGLSQFSVSADGEVACISNNYYWNENDLVTFSLSGPQVDETGVDEVQETAFRIFPNPARDQLTLRADGVLDASISVVTMDGKLAVTPVIVQGNVGQLDIRHLSAGTYFFRVQHANGNIEHEAFVKL